MSWHKGEKAMSGFFPAMGHREFERAAVLVMNLPKMRKQIKELETRLAALQPKG